MHPSLIAAFGSLGPVCRLGLATRGTGRLEPRDVLHALDGGVNFLNWHGGSDGLSRAIADLGARRSQIVICVQFEARTAAEAERELSSILGELHTEYVDVLTFYYVEHESEWEQIAGPGGSLAYCRRAQEQGKVRMLGMTSHQRPLAARIARSGLLDMLMIRYNAAHRGAETDVFPITDALSSPLKKGSDPLLKLQIPHLFPASLHRPEGVRPLFQRAVPVATYTSLRWGALMESTPDDPAGFVPPRAPAWYRWVLQNPSVTVALMAPQSRQELDEDLSVVESWEPLSDEEYRRLADHGQRVRKHAGRFP